MIWQEVEQLIYSSIATDAILNPKQHTNPHHQALCINISLVHFFQPKCKIPAQLKEKVCDAALDFIVHDIRPLHAIEGKDLQSLVSACIQIGAKCGNVTVDTILPSRSTVKRKLDDKCKLVKANLAEVQKAIADYGLFGMTSDIN